MSSRALRKLQREQEMQRQLAAAKSEQQEETEESEEDNAVESQPRNAFDMLNDTGEDDDESENGNSDTQQIRDDTSVSIQPSQPPKSKKKKKKQKKKAKKTVAAEPAKEAQVDDIDRALQELAIENKLAQQNDQAETESWEVAAATLLAPDQKFLNPTNEMRSLFGNIAIESSSSSAPNRPQRRREINLQGGVDLATALSGRYCIGSKGKELGALASRRNCFVQGRPEWPLATSGGLSMENVPTDGFEKEYNIIHNANYQTVQRNFGFAVASMQPENMIGLLTSNPYHLASLLQVSEIAKHQGDHSLCGDLLERALFTVGRSVHSSFPAALREGKARLDFNKSANRELYLAVWRHIRNLEQRGTWRTVFEWSKILLQFNTLSDPYGVTLMIDQAALRGRQHQQLLALASGDAYGHAWAHLPNIQISLVLAYLRSKQERDARRQLAIVIHQYPYILSTLASALEISPLPKSLWGKTPATDAEKLYTELYVTRARDLWNTPEATSLINEVAETMDYYADAISTAAPAAKLEVSLEEARHIMLLEIPALIALLPRQFRNMPTSASDVLPPPSSESDLYARAPTNASTGVNALQSIFSAAGNAAGAPVQGINGMLQQVLNWFHAPAGPMDTGNDSTQESEGQIAFQNIRRQLQEISPQEEITDEVVESFIRNQLVGPEEPVTAAGLGMAGGWDYYQERAEAPSDRDTDSIPELEELPEPTPTEQSLETPTNPHAATVEEADSDDEQQLRSLPTAPADRAILRRVDSNEEVSASSNISAPRPTQPTPQQQPSSASTSDPDPENQILNSADPQRIQRYLLTTGLSALQASKCSPAMMSHYLERLRILRKQQQDWILNMVSQRGADQKEIADRLKETVMA